MANRERALTLAAGVVALVMVGLLSHTTINGRTFGAPRQPDEREVVTLQHELFRYGWAQTQYHRQHQRYAAHLEELEFTPDNHDVVLLVQAADSLGWTAVATSPSARIGCMRSGGQGPAANVPPDSLTGLEDLAAGLVQSCEDSVGADMPSVIAGGR